LGLLLAAAGVVLLAVWLLRSKEMASLEVQATEGATVMLDGGPIPIEIEPGSHTLRVTLAGHHPYEEQLTLEAGKRAIRQAYLAPLDPFDESSLRLMAAGHGISLLPIPDLISPPLTGAAQVQAAPLLARVPRNTRVGEIERARLPGALRDTPAARYLLSRQCLHLGAYRIALEESEKLIEEHPGQKAPLLLALHALSGLLLEETDLYADFYERYRGGEAESKR
jgi:hypothetical protein